jgi:hypothetical protein
MTEYQFIRRHFLFSYIGLYFLLFVDMRVMRSEPLHPSHTFECNRAIWQQCRTAISDGKTAALDHT